MTFLAVWFVAGVLSAYLNVRLMMQIDTEPNFWRDALWLPGFVFLLFGPIGLVVWAMMRIMFRRLIVL